MRTNRTKLPPQESPLETAFANAWRIVNAGRKPPLPNPEREYVFHPTRKWRIDFAWPAQRVAVEIDGGTRGRPIVCHQCGCKVRSPRGKMLMHGGRHNNTSNADNEREKQNALAECGWTVFAFTAAMLKNAPAQTVERVMRRLSFNPELN